MWEVLSSLISSNVTLGTMKLSASVLPRLILLLRWHSNVWRWGTNGLKMGCGTHESRKKIMTHKMDICNPFLQFSLQQKQFLKSILYVIKIVCPKKKTKSITLTPCCMCLTSLKSDNENYLSMSLCSSDSLLGHDYSRGKAHKIWAQITLLCLLRKCQGRIQEREKV